MSHSKAILIKLSSFIVSQKESVLVFLFFAGVMVSGTAALAFLVPHVLHASSVPKAQFSEADGQVLAASDEVPNFVFSANVPSFFHENVSFDKDVSIKGGLTVQGRIVLSGGLEADGSNIDLGTGSITASNILYTLSSGNGISIEGGQKPTIANTGVLSIQDKTGALSFEEGDGITIDGLKFSNADKGSSQNIFKTIAVSGNNSILAGSNTDTLTFVAGNGVTLTTDPANKKLTIAASGGGVVSSQWVTSGSSISYALGNVGIGITNPVYPLDLTGDINITGLYRINGDQISTNSIVEGGNLYYTDARVAANTAVAANTTARHDPATILDSSTIDFSLSGQQITGSVIQSALQTSLLNNDAGFISDLSSFTTDNLTQGSTNLYSQWGTNGSNIYYNTGNVGIGTTAPSANLDIASSVTAPSLAFTYNNTPSNQFASLTFQSQNTAAWSTAYDTNQTYMYSLGFDSAHNVMYAGSGSSGIIYRCDTTTDCDSSSDWTIAYDSPASYIYAITFDATNQVLYAATGNSGIIYRCDTSTDCDAAGDWTVSYDSASTYVLSLMIDTTSHVLYAGADSGRIYRCDLSTSCDASTDWTTADDTTETYIRAMTFDSTNNIIYASSEGGGIIYRCDTSTSCDAAGDWIVSYDTPASAVRTLTLDTIHNILYAGADGGIIYRCDTTTACDAAGDWTTAYDSPQSYIFSIVFDQADGILFAGAGNSSAVYRCDTSTGCSSSSNWSSSFTSSESRIDSLALDTTHDVLYAGSETGAVIYHYPVTFVAALKTYAQIHGLAVSTSDGAETGGLSFNTMVGGADTEVMRLANGNVGIGTITPNDKLDVNGAIYLDNIAVPGTTTNRLYANGGAIYWNGQDLTKSSQWTTTGSNIYFNGNVGIGTTNPTAKLYVAGTTLLHGATQIIGSSDTQQLIIKGNAVQTSNIQEWQRADGGLIAGLSNSDFTVYDVNAATSYNNAGGSGNRAGVVTVSSNLALTVQSGPLDNLVNGVNDWGNAQYIVLDPNQTIPDKYIEFDFGSPKVVSEVTWTNWSAMTLGTWQWQGSNDNATWTNIGSTFDWGTSATQVMTTLSGNTNGYRYYRMSGISGSFSGAYANYLYLQEVTFKIAVPSVAGTSKVAAGYLGIGTDTSLTHKLTVAGTVPGKALAVFNETGDQDILTASASGTTKFVIDHSGNVGIGTTNPTHKLEVSGDAYVNGDFTATGSVSIGNFNMDDTVLCGNTYHTFIGPIGTVGGDECAALNVTQADTNGNIIYRFGQANGTWAGEFYANSTLVGMNTKSAVPLIFEINGSEKMRVDSTGNVGIGTTAPTAKLTVGSDADTSSAITLWGQYQSSGFTNSNIFNFRHGALDRIRLVTTQKSSNSDDFDFTIQSITNDTLSYNDRFTIKGSTGNVGIGTNDPTLGPLQIGSANNAYVSVGGTWTNGSSREFKTNITEVNYDNLLDKIGQLSIDEWNYKVEDPSIKHIGPIAEDFYSIFGVGNDNKHISTIDPAGIALAGVKALSNKLDAAVLGFASTDTTATSTTQDYYPSSEGEKLSEQVQSLSATVASLQTLADRTASDTAFLKSLQGSQVLGASTSAALDKSLSEQDISLHTATVSGTLMVLGRTTVTDLGVTGTITTGLLAIDGLNGQINTVGQPLKLQSLAAAGIDLMAGKVTIDTSGNIVSAGSITAKTVATDELKITGDKTTGSSKVEAGETQIVVKSVAATGKSKVFLTPTTLTDEPLVVTYKGSGSFTVSVKHASTEPITFDWWIVN